MYLTFVKAVILILKHATLLLLSNLSRESALTYADRHYQEANIDLKIQEHLAASSQELSVEQLANFIMATDIGWFILVSVQLISHQVCTEYQAESLAGATRRGDLIVPSPSQSPVETQLEVPVLVPVRRKDPWFKRLLGPLRKATRKNK